MAGLLDRATPELRRWRIFVGVLLVVIAGLRWPATSIGLISDDFMHAGMLAGSYPGESYGPFDLYEFFRPGNLPAYVDKGVAPWWSEPELFGTVLRPLASLLLWLDHVLAPGHERLWLLHSLAWFLATVAAAGAVFRRLFPLPIAALGLVLFACDASVIWPLSWLANRCVLVSALFGFAALAVHLDWRGHAPHRWGPWGPWIEGLLVGLSFAAGEYAIAIVGFVGGIELFSAGTKRERAKAMLPALIPFALYLLAHQVLAYGTFGTAAYVDPFEAPLDWAQAAGSRVPALASSAFWSIPAATVHVIRFISFDAMIDYLPLGPSGTEYERLHVTVAVAGLVLALFALVLARAGLHAHERRALWMLGLGGLLGLVPLSVAPAHTRLLVLIQLGACPITAALVLASWRLSLQRRLEHPAKRLRGLVLAPFAALALALAGPGDLAWADSQIDHLRELQTSAIAAFTQGDLLDQELAERDVIVLASNNQAVGLYGEFMLEAYGWPAPASWKSLAMGEFAMFAFRPSANVLELSAIQAAWLNSPSELFFRRKDQPLVAGDVLDYPSLRAEVLADDDGHPTRVRFSFPDSLDHPRYLFAISTPTGLRRWPVPAIGQRAVVPLPRLPSEFDLSASRIPAPP